MAEGGLVEVHKEGLRSVFEVTDLGRGLLWAIGGLLRPADEEAGSPAGCEPSQPDGLKRLLALARTFADPVRVRILNLLATRCEISACHLHEALELPQSTVSRQLGRLRKQGFLRSRRDGTWVYYRLAQPAGSLEQVLFQALGQSLAAPSEVLAADSRRLRASPPAGKPDRAGATKEPGLECRGH